MSITSRRRIITGLTLRTTAIFVLCLRVLLLINSPHRRYLDLVETHFSIRVSHIRQMQESEANDFLQRFWTGADVLNLECCYCGLQVDAHTTLARTFCLKSQISNRDQRGRYAESFEVPALDDEIVVFHRHLDCLFNDAKFIAISHVWPRDVADAQYRRQPSTAQLVNVARTVREVPARICKGLTVSLGADLEIWHDYISVPQWREDVKKRILCAIYRTFEHAIFTTVYSTDLDAATFHAMEKGSSANIRCRAISDICNIRYFSRVWTAMEFTQSRKICFMAKDFELLSGSASEVSETQNLFTRLDENWIREVSAQGSNQAAEEMVGMGFNLVPWQLGPLEVIRRQNQAKFRTSFANAHTLLARRCVTIETDFLYAIQGILKLDLNGPFQTEMSAALQQLAQGCLRRGDFSPLFMMPASAQGSVHPVVVQSYGYRDIESFGLGTQTHDPIHADVRFNQENDNPVIKAEHVGRIAYIWRVNWFQQNRHSLAVQVRLILEREGTDVDAFVQTLGGRFFGQDTKKIDLRLSENNRRSMLRDKLKFLAEIWSRHRTCWNDSNTTFRLVLREHPTLYMSHEQQHSSEELGFDLTECLGNRDGHFDREGQNFRLSARALTLAGTILTAELKTVDGRWAWGEIDVRTLGLYSVDGSKEHLDWIADAMGLSNECLGSEMTPLSPMQFLFSHGGTIHWGVRSALLEVICASCRRSFLVRTALYADDAQVLGSSAWRVPGLKYDFTLEGGAGFLLNGGRIVGRFVWAAHTCHCPKLAEVEVSLHDIPIPRQNLFEYGKSQSTGWIPIMQL